MSTQLWEKVICTFFLWLWESERSFTHPLKLHEQLHCNELNERLKQLKKCCHAG